MFAELAPASLSETMGSLTAAEILATAERCPVTGVPIVNEAHMKIVRDTRTKRSPAEMEATVLGILSAQSTPPVAPTPPIVAPPAKKPKGMAVKLGDIDVAAIQLHKRTGGFFGPSLDGALPILEIGGGGAKLGYWPRFGKVWGTDDLDTTKVEFSIRIEGDELAQWLRLDEQMKAKFFELPENAGFTWDSSCLRTHPEYGTSIKLKAPMTGNASVLGFAAEGDKLVQGRGSEFFEAQNSGSRYAGAQAVAALGPVCTRTKGGQKLAGMTAPTCKRVSFVLRGNDAVVEDEFDWVIEE